MRISHFIFVTILALTGCTSSNAPISFPGVSSNKVYRIRAGNTEKIQLRMLDAVNSFRMNEGIAPLNLNPQLSAAAASHSRDMSDQNRPWHFGSDGSSPIVRIARAGYFGTLSGELISESYETELETLDAWMSQIDTRRIVLTSNAQDLGFSWYQERKGRIWWTMILGDPTVMPRIPSANPTATRLVPPEVDNPLEEEILIEVDIINP
ncbi:MAG: CAP domain-containing protein [Tateyamaria sp.]|jgi:uncharacterized protein YkwD|nr:CAP domain-containing protein [Tateyamaria sp.]MCH9746722.1 CAP domain-containing protein [Alphaproteobacteria bacterium]HAB36558.1 hypothetical protein [Paracoccaceae bacterium]MBT5301985.1 CAP domain-containing protein [Tateyamaria sp.]MBT6267327.1 CAP domain-containing protein [Tateyamaria sp.]